MVNHGFSTRAGGVSEAPFDSLNLSLNVGDDPDYVIENRRKFAGAIGVDVRRIVVPDQVHSNGVRLVTENDAGAGTFDHGTAIRDTDVLITNTPSLPLALHFADCACIFLLDPVHRAIGVAHAGWKGTVEGAVIAAVDGMTREFGTEPKDLLAAIAPSIGRCCYVVSEDVAKRFYKVFPNEDRVFKQYSSTKWRVDLKVANSILLNRAGLVDSNIAISDECTCCDIDEFFSYRRDGSAGRMGGWIALKEE